MTIRTVIDAITAERIRQINHEGWTSDHDDAHADESMALAAAAYALPEAARSMRLVSEEASAMVPEWWPWDARWWKPKDRRRDLIRAAALIVAEIERLDRVEQGHRGLPSK